MATPSTADPRWAPPGTDTGRRALSRDVIVDAALRVADTDGLDAVSMPRLARELGAAPMSLYRHVASKDVLVDLVLDAAIGDAPNLSGLSPRAGLETWARANHAVFRRRPWTLPLVSSPRRMGPNECLWGETVLGLLVGAGCGLPEAAEVLLAVNSFVRGASIPATDRMPSVSEIAGSGRGDDLPQLMRLLSGAQQPPEDAAATAFERGLQLVLDGVVHQLP
jgi:AcrR family transcriptional regulator